MWPLLHKWRGIMYNNGIVRILSRIWIVLFFGPTALFAAYDCTDANIICIPSELAFTPGANLTGAGKTYVIETDLFSSSDGIKISADNVILDGQDHLISHNSSPLKIESASNVQIKNLNFTGSNIYQSVYLSNSNNVAIDNITTNNRLVIEGTHDSKIENSSFPGGLQLGTSAGGANNNIIADCKFTNGDLLPPNRFEFLDASNNLLHGNIVNFHTNDAGPVTKIMHSHNNILKDNQISGTTNKWLLSHRSSSSGNHWENNTFSSTNQGMYLESTTSNTFVGNTFFARSIAIKIGAGSSSNEFIKNTIIGFDGFSAVWNHRSRGTDNAFVNNTIAAFGPNSSAWYTDSGGTDNGPKVFYFYNNAFYSEDKAALLNNDPNDIYIGDYNSYWSENSAVILYKGATYSSANEYSIKLQSEGNFSEANSIDLQPLFNDLSIYDFNLQADSPLIDAGDPGFSVPVGGGEVIDIGAYEFGAISVPSDEDTDGSEGDLELPDDRETLPPQDEKEDGITNREDCIDKQAVLDTALQIKTKQRRLKIKRKQKKALRRNLRKFNRSLKRCLQSGKKCKQRKLSRNTNRLFKISKRLRNRLSSNNSEINLLLTRLSEQYSLTDEFKNFCS